MGANEPKKKKRYVGKHFRPRFPRQKPRSCEAAAFDPLGAGHGRGAPLSGASVSPSPRSFHGGLLRCGDFPLPAGGGEMVPADIAHSRRFSSRCLGRHEHCFSKEIGGELGCSDIATLTQKRQEGIRINTRSSVPRVDNQGLLENLQDDVLMTVRIHGIFG